MRLMSSIKIRTYKRRRLSRTPLSFCYAFLLVCFIVFGFCLFREVLDNQVKDTPTRSVSERQVFHSRVLDQVHGHAPQLNTSSFPSKVNYVIVDAIHLTGSLEFLEEQMEGWAVIVINADEAEVDVTSCNHCIYYTFKMALEVYKSELPGNSMNDISPAAFVKMAAFRLALSKGANWIYTTHKISPVPYTAIKRVLYRTKDQLSTGLVYNGRADVFNPCSHMIDPLHRSNSAMDDKQDDYFLLRPVSKTPIYYVADECFITDKMSLTFGTYWDHQGPLTHTGSGYFAAIDFHNVLVSRHNAWTLIASLPAQNEEEMQVNVVYNLMVQRILWETSHQIGIIPEEPSIPQIHQKQCEPCQIMELFENVGPEVRKNFRNWICAEDLSIAQCLNDFALDNLQEFFLHDAVPQTLELWTDWIRLGLVPLGQRYPFSEEKLYYGKTSGQSVYFTPPKPLGKASHFSEYGLEIMQISHARAECETSSKIKTYKPVIPDTYTYVTILLVIMMDGSSQNERVPLLDYQYGRFFQNIAFCTWDENVNRQYSSRYNKKPVTFIHVRQNRKLLPYACLKGVMGMHYDVNGYLMISEHVLVNLWKFHNLPHQILWFQGYEKIVDFGNPSKNINHTLTSRYSHQSVLSKSLSSSLPSSMSRQIDTNVSTSAAKSNKNVKVSIPLKVVRLSSMYQYPYDVQRIITAYRKLQSLAHNMAQSAPKMKAWFKQLRFVTKCDECILKGRLDIFYIPSFMASELIHITGIMLSTGTPVNIAMPTAIAGMWDIFAQRILPGATATKGTMKEFRKKYNHKNIYYFTKSPNVTLKDNEFAKFFYHSYLPRLDRDLKDFAMHPQSFKLT